MSTRALHSLHRSFLISVHSPPITHLLHSATTLTHSHPMPPYRPPDAPHIIGPHPHANLNRFTTPPPSPGRGRRLRREPRTPKQWTSPIPRRRRHMIRRGSGDVLLPPPPFDLGARQNSSAFGSNHLGRRGSGGGRAGRLLRQAGSGVEREAHLAVTAVGRPVYETRARTSTGTRIEAPTLLRPTRTATTKA